MRPTWRGGGGVAAGWRGAPCEGRGERVHGWEWWGGGETQRPLASAQRGEGQHPGGEGENVRAAPFRGATPTVRVKGGTKQHGEDNGRGVGGTGPRMPHTCTREPMALGGASGRGQAKDGAGRGGAGNQPPRGRSGLRRRRRLGGRAARSSGCPGRTAWCLHRSTGSARQARMGAAGAWLWEGAEGAAGRGGRKAGGRGAGVAGGGEGATRNGRSRRCRAGEDRGVGRHRGARMLYVSGRRGRWEVCGGGGGVG